jgi:hypothetical protein
MREFCRRKFLIHPKVVTKYFLFLNLFIGDTGGRITGKDKIKEIKIRK